MDIKDIQKELEKRQHDISTLKAKICFDFGQDGTLFFDPDQTPVVMQNKKGESDLEIGCSTETFGNILQGTQDPNIAYMMGKLKIKGSMGLALKLNSLLED